MKKIVNYSFLLRRILFVVFFFSLTACGGGGGLPTNPQHSLTLVEYVGVAQKGSFEIGSDVRVSVLDSSGNPTGSVIKTTVNNDQGGFALFISDDQKSSFFEINVKGFFLDESKGQRSTNKISLSSITNNISSSSVNILTDWATKRTKVILNKKKNLKDSIAQANKELAGIFGINNIHDLDFSQTINHPSDNALMLLLSGALMDVSNKLSINPQIIIDEIGLDFSQNGKLTSKGDDWFIRMQAIIRNDPSFHLDQYGRAINYRNSPTSKLLPAVIPLASRPVANVPKEVFAKPGETIILDGSASHDSGKIINFTWFRVDQKTEFKVPLSDRFIAAPSITAPDKETELLFSLIVTDDQKLTHTAVVKVMVREPKNTPPKAIPQIDENKIVTLEDTAVSIVLEGSDPDPQDIISFVIKTPLQLLHGILEGTAPNLTYTPTQNFFGTESFTFKVNDGSVDSEAATIEIKVNPVNDRPFVYAGPDQEVTEGEEVTLQGLALDDEDGAIPILCSNWTAPLDITLNCPNPSTGDAAKPTFTAPNVSEVPKKLKFELMVVDSQGVASKVDTVVITVKASTSNQAPTARAKAKAGSPLVEVTEVTADTVVTLDGSLSSDPEDGQIVTPNFIWSAPTGVTLINPTSEKPTFTASTASGSPTTLIFTLRVKDSEDLLSPLPVATVAIVVNPKNKRPIADAGSQQIVTDGDTVTLDGSSSSDHEDGQIVTPNFLWSPPAGVILTNPMSANPTFIAKAVSDSITTLNFTLRVKDSEGLLSPLPVATVAIVVNPKNKIPDADAGSLQEVTAGDLVELNGSASSDPEDGDIAVSNYIWTPPPTITLTGATTAKPTFTAPAATSTVLDLVFSLVVKDSEGALSQKADVTITVSPIKPTADSYTCKIKRNIQHTIDLNDFSSDSRGEPLNFFIVGSLNQSSFDISITQVPHFLNKGILTAEPLFESTISESFQYKVKDSHGVESDPATITIIYE